jgi:hypothetical protein
LQKTRPECELLPRRQIFAESSENAQSPAVSQIFAGSKAKAKSLPCYGFKNFSQLASVHQNAKRNIFLHRFSSKFWALGQSPLKSG